MATSRPSYCQLSDVTTRLYSGSAPATSGGGSTVPTDTQRDTYLTSLIQAISRRFDDETGRPPGTFAPVYESRLFSGRGAQVIELDEFASVAKIEINTTPGKTPSWTDYTSDFTNGVASILPMRYWPKSEIFRMSSWYVDPYQTGNVRVTAVWGAVQPDMGQTVPTAPWQGLSTQGAINALSPDGQGGGWWITPEAVAKACAEWTVYAYKASQAGYGDTAGNPSGGTVLYRKGIPPEVQMVIDGFTKERPKMSMITTDGTDLAEENAYVPGTEAHGSPYATVSRWAGWQTSGPSN